MAVAPKLGFKVGARKVDVEEYLPEPGDWEDTVVRHEFEDGWKIVEDVTTYDRKLMAKLTMTCVGGNTYLERCFPGIDEATWWAEKKANFYKLHDTPQQRAIHVRYNDKKDPLKEYEDIFSANAHRKPKHKGLSFEKWLDAYWAWQEKQTKLTSGPYGSGPPKPAYRLMHIEDPEGRPRSCILLAHMEAVTKQSASYCNSNDLGQVPPIVIDGEPFRILEVRIGTGNSAPEAVLPYAVEWYQSCVGVWDQEAFEKAKTPRYSAVKQHEADLDKFRRKGKT